jgi:citronellol/citronellal dehydrogenase
MSMKERVAIITGASRGIGAAVARKLAAEGMAVTLAAKTLEENGDVPGSIISVAEEIRAAGGRALPIQTNVRDVEAIERMVARTVEEFGRVDVLVNNAGALWWYPVTETPAKRFDLMIDVNVRASFLASAAVLPHMKKNRWGHIINMSPPIDLMFFLVRLATSFPSMVCPC